MFKIHNVKIIKSTYYSNYHIITTEILKHMILSKQKAQNGVLLNS